MNGISWCTVNEMTVLKVLKGSFRVPFLSLTSCCTKNFSSSTETNVGERELSKREKRQEILKEIKQGAFKDFTDFRKRGGKSFVASDALFPKEVAKKFPVLKCTTISGTERELPTIWIGKVTLALAFLRGIGQEMCSSYREPFVSKFGSVEGTRCAEINVIDSWIYKLLKRQMLSNLEKLVKEQTRKDNYYCCFENCDELKRTLIQNTYVGHAFLLDRHGYVRWMAHGKPTDLEIRSLLKCTGQLLS